MTTSSDRKF
jgi:hypothetical protein